MKLIKRYKFFIITSLMMILLFLINKEAGIKAINTTKYSLTEMISIIPPIFILLGLLDIWVPKETMMKYMGEGSGFKGIFLAFLLGSAAAGPLYAAFPVAAVFMKKGVKFRNVLIFIGAWSTTKIPMFLFEFASLGGRFAITRLLINIPGIIIISYILCTLINPLELEEVYQKAKNME